MRVSPSDNGQREQTVGQRVDGNMKPRGSRLVKLNFLLADRMKQASCVADNASAESLNAYQVQLARECEAVKGSSDSEIDFTIGRDPTRLHRYNAACWIHGLVDLSSCFVHDCMGGRNWIRSFLVPHAA